MTVTTVHATAVSIDGCGVLIIGPSGSGKSDLALRLIDRGAMLVSDDAVAISSNDGIAVMTAAPNIRNLIEIRGIGIHCVQSVELARLRLIVELTDDIERMPLPGAHSVVAGYAVPCIRLAPFEVSATLKLEYALRSVVDADRWPMARTEIASPESSTF